MKKTSLLQFFLLMALSPPVWGIVPGTGIIVEQVGDDFEEQGWRYVPQHPKSSRNIDKKERGPLGVSQNGRWLEGPHRGTPDLVRQVPTPTGGLFGSEKSLLLQTIRSGVPGKRSNKPQQDDLMIKVKRRLGQSVPAGWNPNCVVRVYVPPFEDWERRSGASFGFRLDTWGTKPTDRKQELEQYWPGLFINYRVTSRNPQQNSAFIMVRGDHRGRDIRGPEVTPGWWTLGMSVTPDGKCHFYARQGVEDLTEDDHLASYFCYGYRCQHVDLFFFNIVSMDNGKSWSTPWVIDDPTFYCTRELAGLPRNRNRKRR